VVRELSRAVRGFALASPEDDGAGSLGAVRRELNRLLALDTEHGWYRLHSLGGVRASALLDVQLEELDASGRLRRRIFSDRMFLGVWRTRASFSSSSDGALVRGAEKTALPRRPLPDRPARCRARGLAAARCPPVSLIRRPGGRTAGRRAGARARTADGARRGACRSRAVTTLQSP
jgi:hypothetical protein